MNTYETLFIINPDLEESETAKAIDIIQDVITAGGGTILKVDKWGKRQLAYQIQKKRDGYYVLLYFQSPPTIITEVNRRYKLTDTIMRHMIIQLPEKQLDEILQSTSRLAESTLSVTPAASFGRDGEPQQGAGNFESAEDSGPDEELMTSATEVEI